MKRKANRDVSELYSTYKNFPTDTNKEDLLLGCLPMIYHAIGRSTVTDYVHNEVEELVSYCMLDLLKVIDMYDSSKGKFLSYAYATIIHALIKSSIVADWRSSSAIRYITRILTESRQLANKLKREPTLEEIFKYSQCTSETYFQALKHRDAHLVSLDGNWRRSEDAEEISEYLNKPDETVDTGLRDLEIKELVSLVVKVLNKKELNIVQMKIGGITYGQLGDMLKVTRQRVFQIYESAIKKVRREAIRKGYVIA